MSEIRSICLYLLVFEPVMESVLEGQKSEAASKMHGKEIYNAMYLFKAIIKTFLPRFSPTPNTYNVNTCISNTNLKKKCQTQQAPRHT